MGRGVGDEPWGYSHPQSIPHRDSRGITSSFLHPVSKKETQSGKSQAQKCAPIGCSDHHMSAGVSSTKAHGGGTHTTRQRLQPHLGPGFVVPNTLLRTST